MPTIGSKVNQKELEAIQEYANICGETISNLIKKVLLTHATMLDGGWAEEHPEYECIIPIPNSVSEDSETAYVEQQVNKVRRILGWKEIHL